MTAFRWWGYASVKSLAQREVMHNFVVVIARTNSSLEDNSCAEPQDPARR